MAGYFRVVLVNDGELIEYDRGEGDGVAEFAAIRDKLLEGRSLVSETAREFTVASAINGDYILTWTVRLINFKVWPFIVSYEDNGIGVDVELFRFYARDAVDAKKKLLARYGVSELPQCLTITKSWCWVYDNDVVILKRKRKGA